MKRTLVCLLCMAMLCGLVGGATAEAGLKPFRIYGTLGSNFTQEEMQATPTYQALAEKFAAKGLKLELTLVESSQYPIVLQSTIATGTLPDFFYTTGISNADLVNLIRTGKVMAIDDALQYSDGTAASALGEGGYYHICYDKSNCWN